MHAFSEALSDCVPCDDTKLVKYVPVVSASVGSRSQGKPRQQLPLQKTVEQTVTRAVKGNLF